MFYLAKGIQALGIADVGYALYAGIAESRSMAEEIVLTLIGVGLFGLGRALERKIVLGDVLPSASSGPEFIEGSSVEGDRHGGSRH